MDLGAYSKIDKLEAIAKKNGIDIPRLRGYRLMKDEKPVTKDELDKIKKECEVDVAKWLVRSDPFWNPNSCCSTLSSWTDLLCDYYLVKDKDDEGYEDYVGIRWDRIHGWKRRILKFEIKKQKKAIQSQYDLWNKYAGKEDVLYIHSRMGGGNWKYYDIEKKKELINQPWYLDRVDDYFDDTYCDFYAKIKFSI